MNLQAIQNIDFQELNTYTIILRTFLAILIGGLVGVERGIKNHTAGLRTYILVCLGSAIVMMTNQYIVDVYGSGDPARMGAQVVSGIGFLGAGTILVTNRNRVKGLTTAAGLWASAAIGLAVGIGFYAGAIVGGLSILAIMTIFRPLKRFIQGKSTKIDLYIITESLREFNKFLEYCSDLRVNILDLEIENERQIMRTGEREIVYYVAIDLRNRVDRQTFVDGIRNMQGIDFIEELELD